MRPFEGIYSHIHHLNTRYRRHFCHFCSFGRGRGTTSKIGPLAMIGHIGITLAIPFAPVNKLAAYMQ